MGWFKIDETTISGPLSKLLSDEEKSKILSHGSGTLLFQAGKINEWSDLRAEDISPEEFIKLHNAIYIV